MSSSNPLRWSAPLVLVCLLAIPASAQDYQLGSGAEMRIRAALVEPTTVDFLETPLAEVIDYLERTHDIPIEFDAQAMIAVEVDTATPVTRNLKNVSLRSALRLLLRDFNLTFQVQDEVLLITSEEGALAHPLVGVYDLSPILPPDVTAQEVVYALTSVLDRRGNPQVRYEPMERALLVRDTEDGHEQLRQLLRDLARVKEAATDRPQPPTPELDPFEKPDPLSDP